MIWMCSFKQDLYLNIIRYTLLYIDRGVYMGKYTPRAPEGYILKKSTDMQGWRVASQYGPNERVERASAGHIEKQPNIRAWRLILSIFTQREIDRSVYRIYTQKHLHLYFQSLSTLKKYFPIKFIYKNLILLPHATS